MNGFPSFVPFPMSLSTHEGLIPLYITISYITSDHHSSLSVRECVHPNDSIDSNSIHGDDSNHCCYCYYSFRICRCRSFRISNCCFDCSAICSTCCRRSCRIWSRCLPTTSRRGSCWIWSCRSCWIWNCHSCSIWNCRSCSIWNLCRICHCYRCHCHSGDDDDRDDASRVSNRNRCSRRIHLDVRSRRHRTRRDVRTHLRKHRLPCRCRATLPRSRCSCSCSACRRKEWERG
mmetsp:Transcript_31026/g.64902  ORF Transcript_31026/g.64902 Transcript_31026/m.64902 type:complete len:232 (+) Transcript_31026:108-803(+)